MPIIHRVHDGATDSGGLVRLRTSPPSGGSTVRASSAGPEDRREIPAEGGTTIRYRDESQAASQGNLFGGYDDEGSPDLGGHDLGSLEKFVSTCTRCPLHEGRTQTVFGSGSPRAGIVFIGEAPGREEDVQGLPFVGRAGKLLTKILASVGMSREEVYITNILKCRPPGNRDPREDEVAACEIYLKRQIELINPALICALGRIAGQNLLKRNAALSVLRQGIHYYNDIKVLVTYHPAALLRNPGLKKPAWEDIQQVRRIYDEAAGGV
ncbi:MAG: uracil-DNA glycosylase [bacterium]|nr:MAG: uracil-DNA glycosylase [bacterium]